MKQALTAKLYLKCPILYRRRNAGVESNLMYFGFEHGDGWFDIVYKASIEIESIAQKMKQAGIQDINLPCATQVKEKFGTLRFYVDNTTDAIEAVIEKATTASAHTCENCGKPGQLKVNGWWQTICDTCQ